MPHLLSEDRASCTASKRLSRQCDVIMMHTCCCCCCHDISLSSRMSSEHLPCCHCSKWMRTGACTPRTQCSENLLPGQYRLTWRLHRQLWVHASPSSCHSNHHQLVRIQASIWLSHGDRIFTILSCREDPGFLGVSKCSGGVDAS